MDNKNPYKKTPIFNQMNVPKGILEKHNTKEGTWGKLIIVKGRLKFIDLDKGTETILDTAKFQIIEPSKYHKVELIGQVEFFIEFYNSKPL